MFFLKKVSLGKYKSYTKEQVLNIEDRITTVVGKNESGKTALLEALAKFNYFDDDPNFKFNPTHDYPRRELARYKKTEDDVEVIRCEFDIDEETKELIKQDLGEGVFEVNSFSRGVSYSGSTTWYGLSSDESRFIKNIASEFDLDDESKRKVVSFDSIRGLVEGIDKENADEKTVKLVQYVKENYVNKAFNFRDTLLDGYVAKKYLSPRLPRLWYFDEYYELPSRVSVEAIKRNSPSNGLTSEQLATARALFELAAIDIDELIDASDFEDFMSELEATSNEITDTIFKYWSTNDKLEIQFTIDQVPRQQQNPEKILDIRVRNNKNRISLPLRSRSKGFNWFFSFIVWFSRIQDEKDKNFILLMDEPGLNLHASAQDDLLKFIEDLSEKYQIIYTTHSPFMVDSKNLHRVSTVYDSSEGSVISSAVQEKDPDTLFPLQAALGYDIAQNLFVSNNNLLVEGPADLNYLTFMSSLLDDLGRVCLDEDITIVPVGGLDKVSSFISLLRGSKLKVACLLDTFNNDKGAQRIKDLVETRIIKEKQIRFFDEFAGEGFNKADIEDLFSQEEYLSIFNKAFPDMGDVSISDLNGKKSTIISKLTEILKGKRFNHYKPSHSLLTMGCGPEYFSEETLSRFESMFSEINKMFLK